MKRSAELRRIDPIDPAAIAAATARPAFDDLRRAILSDSRSGDAFPELEVRSRGPGKHRRARTLSALAAAVVAVVAVLVAVNIGSGIGAPVTTSWHAGHVIPVASRTEQHKHGTWRLVDAVLAGTWQQNTSGPPPGDLDCPVVRYCYALSGRYASASASAPVSESFYASNNVGVSWMVLPMPVGFLATSPLSCGAATTCAVAGTYRGQPVLVRTSDGGHSFTIDPLPSGVGTASALSCPTAAVCDALASTGVNANNMPLDATLLATNDGGSNFSDYPIANGESMSMLSCTGPLTCTAVGTSDAEGVNDWTAGVAAVTKDGGVTWSVNPLPAGFGTSYLSQLSCADADHCALTGMVAGTVANPPQCAQVKFPHWPGHVPTTTEPPTGTVPSAAVRAVSASESAAASAENQRQAANASGAGFGCSGSDKAALGAIATTTDGGLTWTPHGLPSDVPNPQIFTITCPTATRCWAGGSDAIPEQVGRGHNGGSPVLLGTIDGGATWSRVNFSVPAGAPNYDGQSYLSMGSISCATASVCVAHGAAAEGSPTAPIYSLLIPATEPTTASG